MGRISNVGMKTNFKFGVRGGGDGGKMREIGERCGFGGRERLVTQTHITEYTRFFSCSARNEETNEQKAQRFKIYDLYRRVCYY